MIKTRQDLRDYLQADGQYYQRQSGGVWKRLNSRRIDTPQSDQWYNWKYIVALRHTEYHINNHTLYHRIMHKYWLWRLRHYSHITGFQIDPNTCGKGLFLGHYGYIVVNSRAQVGEHCVFSPGVVIGATDKGIPTIGNHVTLCTGAKVVSRVTVGDHAIIAPNTVVIKDVPARATVSGVPAQIIRQR